MILNLKFRFLRCVYLIIELCSVITERQIKVTDPDFLIFCYVTNFILLF